MRDIIIVTSQVEDQRGGSRGVRPFSRVRVLEVGL